MFKSLTGRPLWVNIAVALGGLMILILIFLLSLNWITKHGEARTVPAVIGKKVNEVEKLLIEKGFDLVVQDSVFYDSLPPGTIIRQIPEADNVVKINRTVYVTINRFVAPDIDMPNLIGSSYRNAEMILKNLGLRLGDTTYRFDFAKNSVLEQLYNGASIKAGTKIKVGSRISLVLGSGLGNEDQAVPDLRGLTYEEARAMLDASGITLGVALPDPNVRDTAGSFVYRQSPMPYTEDGAKLRIRAGQMIDIWLATERPNADSLRQVERSGRQQQPPTENFEQ